MIAEPRTRTARQTAALRAEIAALRAALITETRIAEALAQRSRGLVALVETLAQRALRQAADIAEARDALDGLGRSLRDGLAAGETVEAGNLRSLAEATLAAFEMGSGPRIAIWGPSAVLAPEARRLVALTLFDLASRSARFGALAAPEGRVAVDWSVQQDGGLRVAWREFGTPPGADRLRRGAGGALFALLSERFGGPLHVRVGRFGLVAELSLPPCDVVVLERDVVAATAEAALAHPETARPSAISRLRPIPVPGASP